MMGRDPLAGVSHVRGDQSVPLIEKTIPDVLADTVAKVPDNDAAVFVAQGIRWSYAQFAVEVYRLAAALVAGGVTKGARVGIWSPNRSEWLLSQFATARIGAILVCINPAYRAGELEYALKSVGCSVLIAARDFKSSNYVEMLQSIDENQLPQLQRVVLLGQGDVPSGMQSYADLLAMGERVHREALDKITTTLSPDDPINIQFTSGTTGNPKGACLTHRNIVNNAFFTVSTMEFTDQDRLCIPVPFYHCFGMVMGTLGCVTKGATMVIPGEGFEPEATLAAVHTERCTALFGVPTMFVAELALPNFTDYDLSQLRTGIMAGAPCPIEVMRRVQSEMNLKGITIAYGMTETSPVSFQSNVDDPIEQRCTTVGRIHPHVEVMIVDEHDQPVPVGEQGELITGGYSVMQGYWGDAEQTTAAIATEGPFKGWMRTGDLGVMDEAGFCRITGRVKDMICRGGENIYPKEVEDFLFTHPAVALAQVFGIPDAHYGEVAVAWLVLHEGAAASEDEIRAFCKANIAHYKIPAHVRFVDEYPMTVTGKPQKFVMAEMMVQEMV